MDSLAVGVALTIFVTQTSAAPRPYFPSRSLSPYSRTDHKAYNEWYSQALRALGEAPIQVAGKGPANTTVYRFLMVPSFSNVHVIRAERNRQGRARLIWKEKEAGKAGASPRFQQRTRELAEAEWASLVVMVQRASFWTLPPDVFTSGLDGVRMIVEGATPEGYRVVHRWSPGRGSFVRLCGRFLELAKPVPPVPVVDPRPNQPEHLATIVIDASVLPSRAPAREVTAIVEGGGLSEIRATDASGRATFGDLVPGLYEVRLRWPVQPSAGRNIFWLSGQQSVLLRAEQGRSTCVVAAYDPTKPDPEAIFPTPVITSSCDR